MFSSRIGAIVVGLCLTAMLLTGVGASSSNGRAQVGPCLCSTASLVGDTVNTQFGGGPVAARTVQPGTTVELPGAGPALIGTGQPPRWNIDFGPDTIRIDFIQQVATYGNGAFFNFTSLNPLTAQGCPAAHITNIAVSTNKPTSPFNVVASATFTANSVKIQIAPNVGNLDWQPGEFILVRLKYDCATPPPTPTPSQDCCDKLTAVPFVQPNLSLNYRTFTITNLKAPVSPICRVDIIFAPPVTHQGGDLYIDGALVPTGTRFVYPYNFIPNAGAATISATNTVKFNLGVDYTIGWTGTVTFVVTHCDGSKCTLKYGPWKATPPAAPGDGVIFNEQISVERRTATLSFQLRGREKAAKWVGFSVADEKDRIFAGAASEGGARGERTVAEASVEEGGVRGTSVLYRFDRTLRQGEASRPFNLVVLRGSDAPNAPNVLWTTYDADGNPLETGTISPRRAVIEERRPER